VALTLLGQNKAHFATASTTGAFCREHDCRPIFQLMLAEFDLWNLQHHLDNLAEIRQIFNYQISLGIVEATMLTSAVTKLGELADGGYNVGDRRLNTAGRGRRFRVSPPSDMHGQAKTTAITEPVMRGLGFNICMSDLKNACLYN